MLVRSALIALLVGTIAACSEGTQLAEGPVAEGPAGDENPAAAPTENAPAAGEAEPKGPFPIVLLHGMGGFVETEGLVKVKMFAGVPEALEKDGNQVFQTLAPPFDTSEARVKMIVEQLETIMKNTGAQRLNLIGHSQGGLDARVIASPGGRAMGKKIASVTTVATPHLGSGVADFALGITQRVPDGVIDKGSDVFLGIAQKRMSDLEGDTALRAQVTELSTPHMRDVFNPKFKDDPGVRYYSWAGRASKHTGVGVCDGAEQPNDPKDIRRAAPNLMATSKILAEDTDKANDGLVTVENAKWGKFQKCVASDHNGFVIGEGGFDQVSFFRDVVARIRKDGL